MLDAHYSPALAADLIAAGFDTLAAVAHPTLHDAADSEVLAFAAAEDRVAVTEDVTTFGLAIALVPNHVGVVYCHQRRFPRRPSGLNRIKVALELLGKNPPAGLGRDPVVWWLD
ncbi:MAG: DUF5615 family PIN-like protein [Sporichthya sp.]|nr:DUF5615 family PIN-like protein [Sporichthya sp.]